MREPDFVGGETPTTTAHRLVREYGPYRAMAIAQHMRDGGAPAPARTHYVDVADLIRYGIQLALAAVPKLAA